MIKEIVWSNQAEIAYGHIIDRIAERFGVARAQQYTREVDSEVRLLMRFPDHGSDEPLLKGSKVPFKRLIIGGLTKVIYHVGEDRIEIADVWDTRMNPEELVARVLE